MRTRIWAGLASRGIEAMSPELASHLRARVLRANRVRWAALALAPVAVAGSCGLSGLVPGSMPVLVVTMLGALLGGPALLLAAGDAHQRRRKLLADLARAEVEVFMGTVGVATDAVSGDVTRLIASGELGGTEQAQRIEVLCASATSRRSTASGDATTSFLTSKRSRLLGRPRPVDEATLAAGSREVALTPEEQDEMRARSVQLWRSPAALVGPVLYAALGLVMWRAQGSAWLDHYWPSLVIAGLVATGSTVGLVRRYLSAMRVARDATSGVALEIIEAEDDGTLHRMVVLREAGLVWSVDDLPAEWRSKWT